MGPMGATGAQGAQGVAGPQGLEGPAGPAGPGLTTADVYEVTGTQVVNASATTAVQVYCQAGDVVLSGSCEWSIPSTQNPTVTKDRRSSNANVQGWACEGITGSGSLMLTARVLCFATP
jgi:hypothetical protein